MRKDDNDWEIRNNEYGGYVEINGTKYTVDSNSACMVHAILLLVDAINDKYIPDSVKVIMP